MGCGVYYRQLRDIESALTQLKRLGIEESNAAYKALWGQRGKVMTQIGRKFPRESVTIASFFGLSPGTLRLWYDIEGGWMSEARAVPGALPNYRAVSVETAARIIKGEGLHELQEQLLQPDEFLGEE